MMSVTMEPRPLQAQGETYGLWYAGAFACLYVAYLVVFLATTGTGLWTSATIAAANITPPALLGLGARPALTAFKRLSMLHRLAAFAAAAIAFSLSWYVLLAVTLGVSQILNGAPFGLQFLSGPGLVWQIYQGLVIFALLLCATALHDAAPSQSPQPRAAQTILVRTADGLAPVDPAELLAIEANDDASYVVLRTGRRRTNTTLSAWSDQLDPTQFVRVHRSWIVNLKAVLSVEPVGGGRMVAHLPQGLSVPVSRSGARSLRSRAS